MKINHIMVVSSMYEELQRLMEGRQVEKTFRFLSEEQVTNEDLQWADAFVSFKTKRTFDYSQVKWVHSLGAGVDHFLFQKQWHQDVLLTRTICSFGQRIGEYCLSYIVKDLQYHDQFLTSQTKKEWNPKTPRLLSDQKVVIYGTGEIGQSTAKLLSSLSVEVYGVSLSGKKKAFFKDVVAVDQHPKCDIDYIINTLPLTEKTERMFDDGFFQSFENVGFINVGRGASVDEKALLEALDHGHVRFAILDVFTEEPLPSDHPFWKHPNVLMTPHISAVTTAKEAVDCFVETIQNIEAGNSLHNRVDIRKGF